MTENRVFAVEMRGSTERKEAVIPSFRQLPVSAQAGDGKKSNAQLATVRVFAVVGHAQGTAVDMFVSIAHAVLVGKRFAPVRRTAFPSASRIAACAQVPTD
jgi:hypothetical protein